MRHKVQPIRPNGIETILQNTETVFSVLVKLIDYFVTCLFYFLYLVFFGKIFADLCFLLIAKI